MMSAPILVLSILVVITSVVLALFILLHKGRGGGMSDLYGGGMSSATNTSLVRMLDRLRTAGRDSSERARSLLLLALVSPDYAIQR